MAYRKLKADKIFTGTKLLHDHVLVLAGNGSVIDLLPAAEAGEEVEQLEGWLCPGFVNTHCHLELSHMQGKVPKAGGMTDFLLTVLLHRQAPDDEKHQAMYEALNQMWHNGIVALGDISNTVDSIAPKISNQSIRYQNFIELSGFVASSANARLDTAMQVSAAFRKNFPIEQVHITPHAAYSVSEKLFELIGHQSPSIISIHNQESKDEEDFIQYKKGELLRLYQSLGINIDFFEPKQQSSLQYLLPLLPTAAQWILVHNCYTTAADIEALQELLAQHTTACYLCICPNANVYIGNPLPELMMLKDAGLPICLGTDSLTNNDGLSILSELQTVQQKYSSIAVEELLQWATLNGARALQMETQLGSFEKGKQPGVLLLQDITTGDDLANCQVLRLL